VLSADLCFPPLPSPSSESESRLLRCGGIFPGKCDIGFLCVVCRVVSWCGVFCLPRTPRLPLLTLLTHPHLLPGDSCNGWAVGWLVGWLVT